jgi:hypothetical protein
MVEVSLQHSGGATPTRTLHIFIMSLNKKDRLASFGEVFVERAKKRAEQMRSRHDLEARSRYEQELRDKEANEDRIPVTPANWIDNPYFCGPLATGMWDGLKEVFIDICNRRVFEVLCGGSIGCGKSTLARVLHLRSLYVLSCRANPHESFFRRIVSTTPIVYRNMNVNREKAKSAYFTELRDMVQSIPYFVQEFAPRGGVINELRFPKRINCSFVGASKTAAESENMFFCVLDEINLYDQVERSKRSDTGGSYDEAVVVHTSALRRMMSRFMDPDTGQFPEGCMLISICKETYKDSFIRRRKAEIEREGLIEKGRAAVFEWPQWEFWSKKDRGKKFFWIRTATRNKSAGIIEAPEHGYSYRKEANQKLKDGADPEDIPEYIKVPSAGGEFLMEARRNLDEFIRDVCGRPTETINPFIRDKSLVVKMRRNRGDKFPWVPNPTESDEIPWQVCCGPYTAHETDMGDGVEVVSEFLSRRVRYGDVESWEPHFAPGKARFVHIDMGLSHDAAGVAMGCAGAWKMAKVVSKERETFGQVIDVVHPVLWIDVALRVRPPGGGGQIRFAEIVNLVRTWAGLGFGIVRVTADGFQSAMILQTFEDYGYETGVQSVDITTDPYDCLYQFYSDRRISVYENPIYEGEIKNLERYVIGGGRGGKVREKIDHPPNGTKDVSDAVAGIAWAVHNKARNYETAAVVPSPIEREQKDPMRTRYEKDREKSDLMRDGRLEEMFEKYREPDEF